MPTCDMLKNSQYVQNQKTGTSNPTAHFRKLQKQALLLLDTDKPSGNQLNKIYLCKSFTTYLSIWPIWAVSCIIYLELDLNFIDSLHTQFANYKVMEFANTNTLILTKFNAIFLFDFFYSKGSLISSCTCAIWAQTHWLFPDIFATSKYTHLMAFTHQIM